MAIKFTIADPRPELLRMYRDGMRLAEARDTKTAKKSAHDRAQGVRMSLEVVDAFFRSCSPVTNGEPEPVNFRTIEEIVQDIEGGAPIRG